MKEIYRGHEIYVHREKAMGGWDNLYYSITRISNGHIWVDSFTTGEDTEDDYMRYMKARVDNTEDGIDDNDE